MRFRHHDHLRLFVEVANHSSFSAAAEALSLSKGAIGYQMASLEESIGVSLFVRDRRGVTLTAAGTRLQASASDCFSALEQDIESLRAPLAPRVVVGMSTYFASRWLSRRLMRFLHAHPNVSLRIQPMVNLENLRGEGVDIAIRWGDGDWSDQQSELLFACPAFATAAPGVAPTIKQEGLEAVLTREALLVDRDDSKAWQRWLDAAGFNHLSAVRPGTELVIPDPNVRVQAVIDGQGLALNDQLVAPELLAGTLVQISDVTLPDFGYHVVFSESAIHQPGVDAFLQWIRSEVQRDIERPD